MKPKTVLVVKVFGHMLRILVATLLVSIGLVLFFSFREPPGYFGLITTFAKHGVVGVFFGFVAPVCLFAVGFFIARGTPWNEIRSSPTKLAWRRYKLGKWPDETK